MVVYILRAGNKGAIRIGMTSSLESCMRELQKGNAFRLEIIAEIPCDSLQDAMDIKGRLHSVFIKNKIRGQWFRGNINLKKAESIINRRI